VSGQTNSQNRKAEVRAALQLDSEPTDEFMTLLAELGDGDVASGPVVPVPTRSYTPDEIEEVVINGTTGELLARARGGRTLASIGEKVGVTRARIQQLERSTNIEIATFVRVAKACGYEVSVHLRPQHSDLPPLSAVLGGSDAA
jgi:DNA-binding phage protein